MISIRTKAEIIVGILIFTIGMFSGYNARKPTIKEKIVKVDPIIRIVEKEVEKPIYREKIITKYVTEVVTVNSKEVVEVIVTSKNAKELAEYFQKEILRFETADLKIEMEPWIVKNAEPQKYIDMNAKLYYLSWKLRIENKFKVINKEDKVVDTPIMLGFSYSLSNNEPEIMLSKEFARIPFLNIPINLGISYSLRN